ncbi:hypothetical protein SEA_IBANTIK_64 [Streptomyces phage Ibantik]|uniref:WDGH domain-containing protein n=1 Tax=Streptomyces phage Ibantik TaxID=2182397 RepID=A0A2U8UPD8_9CAUD|nr:hypothetical protein QEH36_gp101 [Streptomyces phage Ibantik]AWN05286.1 hypothetical protein SEA_IBANTIK_64 [Streptomyces phage Ibantik]
MNVYRERAHLLAHLAAIYPSRLIRGADPQEPDWPVLFVELPGGQATWHISPDDLDLFQYVSDEESDWAVWDGHSTEEKYRRLDLATEGVALHGF